MKTYLKEVPMSEKIKCFSGNHEACHYNAGPGMCSKIDSKCGGKFVFIKADPKQIIEYYEKSVLRINKTLNDAVFGDK